MKQEKRKKEKKLVKRNLGSGNNILEGYKNYDKHPVNDTVEELDLNNLPLNFKDDSAKVTLIDHTLEHLDANLFEETKELIRTTAKGGQIIITCPSDCNVVSHTKDRFEPNYFNSFLKKSRNHPNTAYTSVTVSKIVVKVKYRTWYEFLRYLIYKIKLMRVKEITWIMTK